MPQVLLHELGHCGGCGVCGISCDSVAIFDHSQEPSWLADEWIVSCAALRLVLVLIQKL